MTSLGLGSARTALALNLIRLRRARGWTQEALAHSCGLHRTYVGDIERRARNVSTDTIERLANALEVDAWVLLWPHHHRSSPHENIGREPVPQMVPAVGGAVGEDGFQARNALRAKQVSILKSKKSDAPTGYNSLRLRVFNNHARALCAPGLRGKT